MCCCFLGRFNLKLTFDTDDPERYSSIYLASRVNKLLPLTQILVSNCLLSALVKDSYRVSDLSIIIRKTMPIDDRSDIAYPRSRVIRPCLRVA